MERNSNIITKSHQHTRKESKRIKNEQRKIYKSNQKTINKMVITSSLSVSTLNVNGLSALMKRHRMGEWIKKTNKQDPYTCCLQETHFRSKDTHRAWKKIFHTNSNIKKKWGHKTCIIQNRL